MDIIQDAWRAEGLCSDKELQGEEADEKSCIHDYSTEENQKGKGTGLDTFLH